MTSSCTGCEKQLNPDEPGTLLMNGDFFHFPCWAQDVRCNSCDGPIIRNPRRILDNHYHRKCFICCGCSTSLADAKFHSGEDGLFENNGWPYCGRCIGSAKAKAVSQKRSAQLTAARAAEAGARGLTVEQMSALPETLGTIKLGSGGFTVNPRTGKKKEVSAETRQVLLSEKSNQSLSPPKRVVTPVKKGRNCGKCLTPLKPEAKFCTDCGEKA